MERAGASPPLPPTVVAAHLETCAAELARDAWVHGVPDDLAAVARSLVAGQRHISAALAGLAERLNTGPTRTAELTALVAVLRAASAATGHAADALAEGNGLVEAASGPEGDTRL